MSRRFEELAWAETPIGEISLRRRIDPTLDVEIWEVRLGEAYLMSSLFTASERALARLALDLLAPSDGAPARPLDVVVGGLGLGYTARTVLAEEAVGSLVVVEALRPVIDWHRAGLVPEGKTVAEDPRCRLVEGDFFVLAAGEGFDPAAPGLVVDAVLLDIDHTPQHTLHPSHDAFYTPAGIRALLRFLRPGGVFALWSDDAPHRDVVAWLDAALDDVAGHVVEFANPLTGGTSAGSVYLGRAR